MLVHLFNPSIQYCDTACAAISRVASDGQSASRTLLAHLQRTEAAKGLSVSYRAVAANQPGRETSLRPAVTPRWSATGSAN